MHSQSFYQKSAESKLPKKYFFYIFVLIPDMGFEPWPNKPTHYLLDYGDFKDKEVYALHS